MVFVWLSMDLFKVIFVDLFLDELEVSDEDEDGKEKVENEFILI